MNNSNRSLLVVDDEIDTCCNYRDIFADLGYQVDMAHDGDSALAKVRQERYAVAVLDLIMPGMDGLALYSEIKRLRPETVAVLVTAFPHHPRSEESLSAGVWRVLSKPVELTQLLALVDEALDQPLVLVVDDDSDLCANLWDLFRERGYRVGIANDVQSAIQRLQVGDFRVVLIDMRLPDGDGAEVFRAVRDEGANARTILITGHAAELAQSLGRLTKEGADAVCYKPFNVDELIATVGRLSRQ
jgi:two-component system, NtrC family, response regulator HydG